MDDELSKLVGAINAPDFYEIPLWPNPNWSQDAAFIAYVIYNQNKIIEELEEKLNHDKS